MYGGAISFRILPRDRNTIPTPTSHLLIHPVFQLFRISADSVLPISITYLSTKTKTQFFGIPMEFILLSQDYSTTTIY